MQLRRRRSEDDGFIVALSALLLVSLMAMAAFAVDLGGVYNARRQDQSAADMAALAGVQELPATGPARSEAIDIAEKSLGVTPGALDFNSCAGDPGALHTSVAGANCLSIDSTGTQLRVRLPDQDYSTFFAHLVGVESFSHSAFAIAELQGGGFAGVLPFGIPSIGGGGGYICPATPPSGLASEPCSGPTSGNFGYLNMALYSTNECNTGGGSNRFGQNLAMGADHQIVPFDGQSRLEHTLCPTIGPDGPPNVMKTETGNIANRVADGMFTGPGNPHGTYPDGEYGRLARTSPLLFDGPAAPSSAQTIAIGGLTVDDNPLWSFIPASLPANTPSSCQRSVFVDGSGNPRTDLSGLNPNFGAPPERDTFRTLVQSSLASSTDAEVMLALMDRCFTHYLGQDWGGAYGIAPPEPSSCGSSGCTGPVFGVNSTNDDSPDLWDIQYTARFGYVPEFPDTCNVNGTSDCPIERFRAIYIQQTCMGSGHCTPFDPGFSQSHSAPKSVTGVTMWAFPETMLPGGLGGANAPNQFGVNRFATLVR